MSKQNHKTRPQPRIHGSECDCPTCAKARRPAPGGAREITFDNVQGGLPRLSDDAHSRFARMHDAGREAGRQGKLGYVVLNPALAAHLDGAHDLARRIWGTLGDEEQACFVACVVERLPQRVCAERLGLSQPTVSRRLRSAQDALAECREDHRTRTVNTLV